MVTEEQQPVVVWTRVGATEWSREDYEDLGFEDLVRVRLGWYVGGSADSPGTTLVSTVTSTRDYSEKAGGSAMIDRTHVEGSSEPDEVDYGEAPVFLGSQLAGWARSRGTVRITEWDGAN